MRVRRSVLIASLCLSLPASVLVAQRLTPADLAARFTGTWQMNMELSPDWAAAPARGGAPAGRGGGQQAFAVGFSPMAGSGLGFQRGGGRGGGGAAAGPMNEADKAGATYMAGLRSAPATITIKATADSITFNDARGERTFAVDNKNTRITSGAAEINTKSRWDNRTLKQEWVYGETRITHDYELNNEGNRINFKMIIQNMSSEGPPREAKAVYDKKP